jgi:hypothetical protein
MGIGEQRIVVVEGFREMGLGQPLALIVGEVVEMEPVTRPRTLAAIGAVPPLVATLQEDGAICLGILFQDHVRATVDIDSNEGLFVAVVTFIMLAIGSVVAEAVVAPFLALAGEQEDLFVRTGLIAAMWTIPGNVGESRRTVARNIALADDEMGAIVGKVSASVDIGDDELITMWNAPDAGTIEGALGVAGGFEDQAEARDVAVKARID